VFDEIPHSEKVLKRHQNSDDPCIMAWDHYMVGPEAIQEMEEQMQSIRQRIKEAQDRQKSYADAHRVDRSYEVGDRVFLRVKPHKSAIKFGKGAKLSPRFVGPFEVVEKRGPWPID
jgi:hypothetical protein